MIKQLILAAAATALLAACGATDDQSAPAPDGDATGVAGVKFNLENATGHTLTHLYLSPAASDDWDHDILGDQTVPAGRTAEVSIDDGVESCMYDLRAHFDDGDAIDVRGVDVCEIEGTTVTVSE